MSKRPPGSPPPKAKHVGLLDDAINILSAVDPTTDQIPEFQRALGTIDELLDDIRLFCLISQRATIPITTRTPTGDVSASYRWTGVTSSP